MRLIDAGEVLKALGEAPLVWDEFTDEYELGQRKQWEQDVEAIKALPTIEAEPVRRGRWLKPQKCAGGYIFKCSLCGKGVYHMCDVFYCPNCGAKMED